MRSKRARVQVVYGRNEQQREQHQFGHRPTPPPHAFGVCRCDVMLVLVAARSRAAPNLCCSFFRRKRKNKTKMKTKEKKMKKGKREKREKREKEGFSSWVISASLTFVIHVF